MASGRERGSDDALATFRELLSSCHHVLFDLAVRQCKRCDSQCFLGKLNVKTARDHSAAEYARGLRKRIGWPERLQALLEIFDGLLAKVGIGVVGEHRSIDAAALQVVEDTARLFDDRRRIGAGE